MSDSTPNQPTTPPKRKRGRPRKNPPPPPPAIPPEPESEDPLSPNERLFVSSYLIDRNATRAYSEVYPGTTYEAAKTGGARLLRVDRVKREIKAGINAIVTRHEISQDAVLEELARLAFSDPLYFVSADNELLQLRDVPIQARRAVASVETLREQVTVTTNGRSRTTTRSRVTRYKFHPKIDALDKLAAYLGLKTSSIPEIEVLLRMFPQELSAQLRPLLAASSMNGHSKNGKH